MPNVTAKPMGALHTACQAKKITAYLGLGANLGDREASILTALREIGATPKIEVGKVSSLYETKPVGPVAQPDFLNAACEIRTTLEPQELLQAVLHLENKMGRVRTQPWGPRVIDIDVLLYGSQQLVQEGLTVPHPRLHERDFVLKPLAEIAPDAKIPGFGISAKKMQEQLRNNGNNFGRETVVTRHGHLRQLSDTEAAAR